MGRKGIGKLGPLGVCREVEVRSAGGPRGEGGGYAVSHFAARYGGMAEDMDGIYEPEIGAEDGGRSRARGTRIVMSDFRRRRMPDMRTFGSQLARRFARDLHGVEVVVRDAATGESRRLTGLEMEVEDGTMIRLDDAIDANGARLPVRDWIAYSVLPHPSEGAAGVGICARRRPAAATTDFGRGSGYEGDPAVRSCLAGEVHAGWLDDGDGDLIATDRRDIRWSTYRCEALREWGQAMAGRIGAEKGQAKRDATYRIFAERSGFKEAARDMFMGKGTR